MFRTHSDSSIFDNEKYTKGEKLKLSDEGKKQLAVVIKQLK